LAVAGIIIRNRRACTLDRPVLESNKNRAGIFVLSPSATLPTIGETHYRDVNIPTGEKCGIACKHPLFSLTLQATKRI